MLSTTTTTDLSVAEAYIAPERVRPARRASDALAQRLSAAPVHTFDAKEHIFVEGDPATDIYKVEAGHVAIYKMMPDGRRQVVGFASPGDLIGLGAMGEHTMNAQATTRTRVRCLPLESLNRIVRDDAALGLKLYEALSRELSEARDLLVTVSQKSATERVAAFLMAISRRNARNGENPYEFVLPMTRNDIGDFLGLTIETVSRTFSKLRLAGLIGLDQSILVTIEDLERLEAIAEGAVH